MKNKEKQLEGEEDNYDNLKKAAAGLLSPIPMNIGRRPESAVCLVTLTFKVPTRILDAVPVGNLTVG